MNLKELIENRYSVRTYSSKTVEDDKLNYILECARLAPSACNFQPWQFYVVANADKKQEVIKSYEREWVKNAPIFIIVCADKSQSWERADGKNSSDIDASIAAEHICLATAEQGLGTCWICNFKAEILSEALNLPKHIEPIAIFPIGYIDTEKSNVPEKKRKTLAEVTKWI